jgi:CheY-like chemotaxis protein
MGMSVMVVEDDADIRDAIAELLLENGYLVTVAEHGAEALRLLRENGACTIVLDLMMPIMDGVDFRQAQLADRSISGIPFILLTSRIDWSERGRALGALACLQKPFAPQDLLQAVERSRCAPA